VLVQSYTLDEVGARVDHRDLGGLHLLGQSVRCERACVACAHYYDLHAGVLFGVTGRTQDAGGPILMTRQQRDVRHKHVVSQNSGAWRLVGDTVESEEIRSPHG
jgi:hypothetical protein